MLKGLRQRWTDLQLRRAQARVRRRAQHERVVQAQLKCLGARHRRKLRLASESELQQARRHRRDRAAYRRRRSDFRGSRGIFCAIGQRVHESHDEDGSVTKSGMILIACLAMIFASMLLVPIVMLMGVLTYIVTVLIKLPGAQQVLSILTTLTCNKVTEALESVTKKASGLFGDITGTIGGAINKAFDSTIGNVGEGLSKALKGLGGGLDAFLPGDSVKWAFDKTAGGVSWVTDSTGNIVASPLTALEAGAKLTEAGAETLGNLKDMMCKLKDLVDLFKEQHLEDPLRAALSCANWPEYLGPVDKKWCLDGARKKAESQTVPPWMVPIYQAAGDQYNVPWQVLAAINWNDTEYGSKALAYDTGQIGAGSSPLQKVKLGLLQDIDNLKKAQREALQNVYAQWQVRDPKKHDRVGWIPFDKEEWAKDGVDFGQVPPGYDGNPYKGDACPAPIDINGDAVGGLGLGSGDGKIPPYPGKYPDESLAKEKIAQWMAAALKANGLPPELGVMAALVESGLKTNLLEENSDADSAGFWQMRSSIWDKGDYKGYKTDPVKQIKWFIDQALALKKKRGEAYLKNSDNWGEFIADVERPAAQYRGRYQPMLAKARKLIGGASSASFGNADVNISFIADRDEDGCDPVDSVFALARYLSRHGAAGDTWPEADAAMAAAKDGPDGSVSGPIADRIITLAKKEYAKGVFEEPPGSNDSADIRRYHTATKGAYKGAPWCSYFTSYIAKQAGVPVGPNGAGFGAAKDNYTWGQQKKIAHDKPEAGDLIVFGGSGHVGIVIAVDGPIMTTIEGNSSQRVNRLKRNTSDPSILGYVRLAELKGEKGGGSGAKTDTLDAPDSQSATAYAKQREGRVSFAVADENGDIISSYRATADVNSASLTKAMIMVAALRETGDIDEEKLRAMIIHSDNAASNALYAQVGGATAIREVADDAGMKGFELINRKQNAAGYVLGYSQVNAADQARFFARVFKLVPESRRELAKKLLSSVQEGRWGVFAAADSAFGKSGWRPEDNGRWTVNNGGHVDGRGIAILTEDNPNQAYGVETLNETAKKLFSGKDKVTTGVPDEVSDAPPKEFDEAAVPPLDQLERPNPELPSGATWVKTGPDGKYPSFDSGLKGAGPLPAGLCTTNPLPSVKQMQLFKAAGAALKVPWEAVGGLVGMRSQYGCEYSGRWAVYDNRYLTDAGGDGKVQESSLLDMAFSAARTLRAFGAEEDINGAVRRLFKNNKGQLALAAAEMRKLGLTTKGLIDLNDGLIGQAIDSRDHTINENLCKDDKRYVDCIARLYIKIRAADEDGDGEEGSAGDSLTGGCDPDPVPDLTIKPFTDKAMKTNRARDGINVTGGETQGRADAMAATVAVVKQLQSCTPALKENWKRIQINDWNSPGHASHKNGGDLDFTITNVTSYDIPAGHTSYNRKVAIRLARLFLRAGAVEIYFNDPVVRRELAEAREQVASEHPDVKKKMGDAWRDHPVGNAYVHDAGGPSLKGNDGLHNNHFHVRWYTGPGNSTPANIKVYLSEDSTDAAQCDKSSGKKASEAEGPFGKIAEEEVGDSTACAT